MAERETSLHTSIIDLHVLSRLGCGRFLKGLYCRANWQVHSNCELSLEIESGRRRKLLRSCGATRLKASESLLLNKHSSYIKLSIVQPYRTTDKNLMKGLTGQRNSYDWMRNITVAGTCEINLWIIQVNQSKRISCTGLRRRYDVVCCVELQVTNFFQWDPH